MRYQPPHEIRYWTRAKWICEGALHEHLSEAAALKCEADPNAFSMTGGNRYKKRDGTYR